MEYELELAKSNKSVCMGCHKSIKKDTLRIKKTFGFNFGHLKYGFLCKKCGKEEMQKKVMEIEHLLIKMRRF